MAKRPRPNWIVQSDSAKGPLDSEQVSRLAQDFNLSESEVSQLSENLIHPLSSRLKVRGVIEGFEQDRRGPAELEKLFREVRQAEVRLQRAVSLYSQLEIQFPALKRKISNPNVVYKEWLSTALMNVEQISSMLARSTNRHEARFTGNPNKRRNRDERRGAILSTVFDAWHSAGRKVSISTIGSTSERTGPLVDFTNAVVRCITDPATDLSGETIWTEIKEWRRYKKYRAPSVLISDK